MSILFKVPTHLDGRTTVVGRYTARELVPLVAGLFAAAGLLAPTHATTPLRLVEALAVALLGAIVGVVRPSGRALPAWGRLALAYLLSEHTSAWAPPSTAALRGADLAAGRPPHLAAALGGPRTASSPTPAPVVPVGPASAVPRARTRQRLPTPAQPFVPVAIADDVARFADGHRCAVLECSGTTAEGLDAEQQRARHLAYHAFLLGLAFPIQVVQCADPVELAPYAARRLERLAGQSLSLRRLASADTAYMRRSLEQAEALERHTYLVIPLAAFPAGAARAPGRGPRALRLAWRRASARRAWVAGEEAAEATQMLAERCALVQEGLAQTGIYAWRLDTAALHELYYHRLCPRTARLQPADHGHVAPIPSHQVVFFDDATGACHSSSRDDHDARVL